MNLTTPTLAAEHQRGGTPWLWRYLESAGAVIRFGLIQERHPGFPDPDWAERLMEAAYRHPLTRAVCHWSQELELEPRDFATLAWGLAQR